MSKPRTTYEQISTTPTSEIRAMELLPHIDRIVGDRPVVAIAGESGSGKSTTATSLQLELQKKGKHAAILHLDNYFKEIPSVNDSLRRKDFERVGLAEINIDMLQEAILAFKSGQDSVTIPVLSGDRKAFIEVALEFRNVDILLVEGTFVFELDQVDLRVFLALDYQKSLSRRIARGRDTVDEFSEKVLEREHSLIQPYSKQADLLIGEDGIIRQQER